MGSLDSVVGTLVNDGHGGGLTGLVTKFQQGGLGDLGAILGRFN